MLPIWKKPIWFTVSESKEYFIATVLWLPLLKEINNKTLHFETKLQINHQGVQLDNFLRPFQQKILEPSVILPCLLYLSKQGSFRNSFSVTWNMKMNCTRRGKVFFNFIYLLYLCNVCVSVLLWILYICNINDLVTFYCWAKVIYRKYKRKVEAKPPHCSNEAWRIFLQSETIPIGVLW